MGLELQKPKAFVPSPRGLPSSQLCYEALGKPHSKSDGAGLALGARSLFQGLASILRKKSRAVRSAPGAGAYHPCVGLTQPRSWQQPGSSHSSAPHRLLTCSSCPGSVFSSGCQTAAGLQESTGHSETISSSVTWA